MLFGGDAAVSDPPLAPFLLNALVEDLSVVEGEPLFVEVPEILYVRLFEFAIRDFCGYFGALFQQFVHVRVHLLLQVGRERWRVNHQIKNANLN
jgi:hypothetical protein